MIPMRMRVFRGAVLAAVFAASAAPVLADDAANEAELGRLLAQPVQEAAAGIANVAEVRRFYAARGGRLAWRQGEAWSPDAKAAVAALQGAGREGLDPRDYLSTEAAALPPSPTPAEAAHIDLLLSAGMLRYIGDVRAGRVIPSQINPYFDVHPERPDAPAALRNGLASADFAAWLSSLPPGDAAYAKLRDALAAFREIAAGGDWPQLGDGPTLKFGATSPDVAVLRRQLSRFGDLHQSATADSEFDIDLDAAVRRFQSRSGLNPDGAVGAKTRAALDVPPQRRVQTIIDNLERLRWFARPAAGRYIVINAAGFELNAIANGKVVLRMPVIVGKAKMATPMFPDDITGITFLPSWTVPPSIARKEILPKLRADPDYLAKHNMRAYSGWNSDACEVDPHEVDWKAIRPSALQQKFVQQPGPSNALGNIRFTLHNEFGIFMHDTPAKKLFGSDVRTYSHGCIRVGDAAALAAFALDGDPDWPPAAIAEAVNGTETKRVELPRPVPVEVTYLTAWVDDRGIVQFRPDIYGRDPPLERALEGEGT